MSIFRLDRDTFDRQLAAMEANGQAFEEAQSAFAVAAHSAAAQLIKPNSSGASGTSSSSPSGSGSGASGPGGVQWSGIGELDQFGSPLQAAAVMVDARMASASRLEKMASASRLEKKGVADMRASLASFAALNESEKQAYLARLTALDERFTYKRPEEMASIVQAYDQARAVFDAFSKWGGK